MMLEIQGLTKHYGDACVFSGVDLCVAPGEFVALLGEYGVGPSTLLTCIAGLDDADRGDTHRARVDAPSLPVAASARLRRDRLGVVLLAAARWRPDPAW